MWFRIRPSQWKTFQCHNMRVVALLLIFTILCALYNATIPEYEAPDEPQHIEYFRYISENRAFPSSVPSTRDPSPGAGTEVHQPPLYYAIVAVATSWIRTTDLPSWHPNPFATWSGMPTAAHLALHREDESFPYHGVSLAIHVARLISSLMGAVTVLCTYAMTVILLRRNSIAIGAASIVSFTPGFLFSSATVNNDNAVTMFYSITLLISICLLQLKGVRIGHLLAYGLSIGLAVLSKSNGLQLLPVSAATLVFLSLRGQLQLAGSTPTAPKCDWRSGIGRVGRVAGIVSTRLMAFTAGTYLLLLVPYAISILRGANWQWMGRTNSGLALWYGWLSPQWITEVTSIAGREHLGDLVVGLFASYWGVFGWQNVPMSSPVYVALAFVVLAAVLGLVRSWRDDWRARKWQGDRLGGLVILALSTVIVFWITANRNYAGGSWPGLNHGRFLFPAISAIGLFLAAGLSHVRLPFWRLNGLFAAVVFLFMLAVASPFVYVKPSYDFPPVPVRSTIDQPAEFQRTNIEFPNRAILVAFSLDRLSYRAGEAATLTLYWQAVRDHAEDFVALVHFADLNGMRRAGIDEIPLSDLFPPHQWRKGELIREERHIDIPSDTPSGPYSVWIGMYEPNSSPNAQQTTSHFVQEYAADVTEKAKLADIRVKSAKQATVPTHNVLNFQFADEVGLIGYDLTPLSSRSAVNVTLYWRALALMSKNYTISVQVLGPDDTVASQHDGEPCEGLNPTASWEMDEQVTDKHLLAVPLEGQQGYRLAVVVYDRMTGMRLPVFEGDHEPKGDNAIIHIYE